MDNAAISRRWFEEVWNGGREQTTDEMLPPDVTTHGLSSRRGTLRMSRLSRPTWLRRLLAALVLVAFLAPATAVALSPASPLTNFPTEEQAQRHCPADTVVWLNLPTGIYHFRGQRWYGRTNSGAYVCRQEADHSGMRATRNAQ